MSYEISSDTLRWKEELNGKKISQEVEWESYDAEKSAEELAKLRQEAGDAKNLQLDEANKLKNWLNNTTEDKEKEVVENFIKKECSEPIEGINNVIPYEKLAQELIKSAEENNMYDVAENIKNYNYGDIRIYDLPKYKELLKQGFILPSDIRPYYKATKWKPEHHLWIDYQVEEWKDVKTIYDGTVVESGRDWWLWHKVIIEHITDNWIKFYSLYGHLWKDNLIPAWKAIKKWDVIWNVWKSFSEENWKRPSHLHFQIMEREDSPKWHSSLEWIWNYDVLKSFRGK